MTPLRKRMIHELELRRKAPGTVSSYVKDVEELARYYGRSTEATPARPAAVARPSTAFNEQVTGIVSFALVWCPCRFFFR